MMVFRIAFALPVAWFAIFLAGWGLSGPYLDSASKQRFAVTLALVLLGAVGLVLVAARLGVRDWGVRALVLAVPLLITSCNAVTFPQLKYRVKVIATIAVAGQEITEEGVWEYQAEWNLIPFPGVRTISHRVIGDALIFPLGSGQLALAMGNGVNILRDGFMGFYEDNTGRDFWASDEELPFLKWFVGKGGPRNAVRKTAFLADLPPGIRQSVPLKAIDELLYLPSSRSPTGFESLQPEQLQPLRTKLVRVEVETTKDPVTRQASQRVVWLDEWITPEGMRRVGSTVLPKLRRGRK